MFQSKLVKFCAPTLAKIKCASLFKFKAMDTISTDKLIYIYNKTYNKYGLFFFNIFQKNNYNLIYIYRPNYLVKNLSSTEIKNFLKLYDYELNNLDDTLNHLKYRFELLGRTPHEIGLFLGYPLCDVKGFIYNKGKNYKFCGLWKVYANEIETISYFDKCKKCTSLYCKLFQSGISLEKLITFNNILD